MKTLKSIFFALALYVIALPAFGQSLFIIERLGILGFNRCTVWQEEPRSAPEDGRIRVVRSTSDRTVTVWIDSPWGELIPTLDTILATNLPAPDKFLTVDGLAELLVERGVVTQQQVDGKKISRSGGFGPQGAPR